MLICPLKKETLFLCLLNIREVKLKLFSLCGELVGKKRLVL